MDTFNVRVRRQDSTIENVKLMEEMFRFLDTEEPDAVNKYLAHPQSFEYNGDSLKDIQGFPEKARTIFSRPQQSGPKNKEEIEKEKWLKRALSDSSEAKVYHALEMAFQARHLLNSLLRIQSMNNHKINHNLMNFKSNKVAIAYLSF